MRHNGELPRDGWGRAASGTRSSTYHEHQVPGGYRRLTLMMLDYDVVTAGPSTGYGGFKIVGGLGCHGWPPPKTVGKGLSSPHPTPAPRHTPPERRRRCPFPDHRARLAQPQ
jgi:hypothetical protein